MNADEWERALGTWRVCQHELEGGFCPECAAEIRRVFTADARAAGYAEAKADAANAVHADLSLFDEGMDGVPSVRDFVHVYKRRVALVIAGVAPATTKESK